MKSNTKKRRQDDSITSSVIRDAFDNIELISEAQPNTIRNEESFEEYRPIQPQRGASLPVAMTDNHSQSQIDPDVQMKSVVNKEHSQFEMEEQKEHNNQQISMFGSGNNTQNQPQDVNINLIIKYKKIYGENALKMMESDIAQQLKGMVGGAKFGKHMVGNKESYIMKSTQLAGKIQPTNPSYFPKELPFYEQFKSTTDHLLFLTANQIATRGCQICSGFGHGSQSCTTWMVLKNFGTGRSFVKNIIKEAKRSVTSLIQLGPVHIDMWPLQLLVSAHLRQCIEYNQSRSSAHATRMLEDAKFLKDTIEAQFTKMKTVRCNFCRGFGHVVYQNVKNQMIQCNTQTVVEKNIQADSEATMLYLKWKQQKQAELQTVFYQESDQVSLNSLFNNLQEQQPQVIDENKEHSDFMKKIVGFVYYETYFDFVEKFVARCEKKFRQLENTVENRKQRQLFQQAGLFIQNYEYLVKEWAFNRIKASSLKIPNKKIEVTIQENLVTKVAFTVNVTKVEYDLAPWMVNELNDNFEQKMKQDLLDDEGNQLDLAPLDLKKWLGMYVHKALADFKKWLSENQEATIELYLKLG